MNPFNSQRHRQTIFLGEKSFSTVLRSPLCLTSRQKYQLLVAAAETDEHLWCDTMEQAHADGLNRQSPEWDSLAEALMIPWFETMTNIMVDCECSFEQVIALTWDDVNIRDDALRFQPRGWVPVPQRWMDEVDMIPRRDNRVFFRLCEHEATKVWLRMCADAGVLGARGMRRTGPAWPVSPEAMTAFGDPL